MGCYGSVVLDHQGARNVWLDIERFEHDFANGDELVCWIRWDLDVLNEAKD